MASKTARKLTAPLARFQLCLCAAACAASKGLGVLYVDTTAGFCAARLAYFLQRSCTGPSAARLSAVRCVRAFDAHAVLALLNELASDGGTLALPDGQVLRPSLLVVDSVSAVLSPLLSNKQFLGHAVMVTLAAALRALADDFSIAVLCTNHTVAGREGVAGSLKPALGESWKSQPHTRIQLTMGAYDTGMRQQNQAAVTLGRGLGERGAFETALPELEHDSGGQRI